MSHSLPGFNLIYLPEDNLAPEKYERIISPFQAWSHIEDEYDFDDHDDDGFNLIGMREKPAYRSPNQPLPHGLGEKSRLKSMVRSGEVVMLSPLPGPAGLFYIDDNGALICTHRGAFELSGADGVIREYQRSVARRDYRNRGGKPRPTVRERRRPVPEPEPYIPAVRKKAAADPAPKKREITLTLGVFFDGTGNNAVNVDNMLQTCNARHYNLSDPEAEGILGICAQEDFGLSGTGATSYLNYHSNIARLSGLYKKVFAPDSTTRQMSIYIDGIGTEAGKPDSTTGLGLGISDTGVLAKTDKAVSGLAGNIQAALDAIRNASPGYELIINALQYDIFGFSRGAAAARHFANRIQSEEPAIISAIREGLAGIPYTGAPAGKTRFIGIFDTVAAIGRPANGLNPHSADTGDVNLMLRPGVAEKVFHITAQHECRFNFALNSVKPAWPELTLPGVHSDIGGGYLPVMRENLFLTRPRVETVPLSLVAEQSRGWHQADMQRHTLETLPTVGPLLRGNDVKAESWSDPRVSPDRYGQPQKHCYSALTLRDRTVKNDWSKVTLRVMLEAAQEAGVLFDAIDPVNPNMQLPAELLPLCEKAINMGKAVRGGQSPAPFSQAELESIAHRYIHCSAHWNAVVYGPDGQISGGAAPAEIISFVNRPDEQWRRTVYNMDGKKV